LVLPKSCAPSLSNLSQHNKKTSTSLHTSCQNFRGITTALDRFACRNHPTFLILSYLFFADPRGGFFSEHQSTALQATPTPKDIALLASNSDFPLFLSFPPLRVLFFLRSWAPAPRCVRLRSPSPVGFTVPPLHYVDFRKASLMRSPALFNFTLLGLRCTHGLYSISIIHGNLPPMLVRPCFSTHGTRDPLFKPLLLPSFRDFCPADNFSSPPLNLPTPCLFFWHGLLTFTHSSFFRRMGFRCSPFTRCDRAIICFSRLPFLPLRGGCHSSWV